MTNPIPVESADFSEVRRHPRGSDPLLIRRGVLAKLETNGTITVLSVTGSSFPQNTALLPSSLTNLYGVITKDAVGAGDPVSEQTLNYGGQQVSNTEYAHVVLIGRHREIIVPTISPTTGEVVVGDAVPANIGKGVTIRPQNYGITVGTTKHWCFAGAHVNNGTDGIIVGIAGRGRVIVRLKRSFFAELQ